LSSDRPGLRAVPDVEGEPAAEPGTPEPEGRGNGWLKIALFLALVAALAGYVYEEQRAQALESRIGALQSDLQDARRQLQAHEERMQVVRAHVDDLVGRVSLLQQAVAPEPGAVTPSAAGDPADPSR